MLSGNTFEGVALSPGVWNNKFYPPHVIDEAPWDQLIGAGVSLEHRPGDADDGIITGYRVDEDHNLWLTVELRSPESLEKIKNPCGFSLEQDVWVDKLRKIVTKIDKPKRVTLTENPACKVCWLNT